MYYNYIRYTYRDLTTASCFTTLINQNMSKLKSPILSPPAWLTRGLAPLSWFGRWKPLNRAVENLQNSADSPRWSANYGPGSTFLRCINKHVDDLQSFLLSNTTGARSHQGHRGRSGSCTSYSRHSDDLNISVANSIDLKVQEITKSFSLSDGRQVKIF